MIKHILLLFILMFFFGYRHCDTQYVKKPSYLHGFIYDKNKRTPIQGIIVEITEEEKKKISITDEKGHFEIDTFLVGNLYFSINGKEICVIRTGGVDKSSGNFNYNFSEGVNDTLFIDISKYEK